MEVTASYVHAACVVDLLHPHMHSAVEDPFDVKDMQTVASILTNSCMQLMWWTFRPHQGQHSPTRHWSRL